MKSTSILVNEITREPVTLPFETVDFRGDKITVIGFTAPGHEGSTGRIETNCGSFFPSVAGLKIIHPGA